MDIKLDYAVPCVATVNYVTLFYEFYADTALFEDVERADHAQLRFRLTPGDTSYWFPDGSTQEAGDVHLIGPTSGAFRVRAGGPVHVVGMGLTPAGWAALVRSDASAMLNRVVDAQALFGAPARETLVALRQAPSREARLLLCGALVQRLAKGADRDVARFMRQVDSWLGGSASPDIDDLLAMTGVSRRQVERRCNRLYGAPPKLLARKYRALRAAVALALEEDDIDEAIARGFYDQSHLIREIKHFTGFTPGQMREDPSVLARLTIARRRALAGSVAPTISET